jgi:hypothetical protein
MQQRIAAARRDSAARAVARANGTSNGKWLGIFPRRQNVRERLVDVNDFREQGEDVWKAIRF